jgi:hypothetical protein
MTKGPDRTHAARRWVARACVPVAAIGIACAAPQRGLAQTSGDPVGVLAADDGRFRARFTELLIDVPTRDLAAGFQLARDLGPAAAPVLWRMHAAEKSNARRRITVLAAAILAEGAVGDDRTLAAIEADRTPPNDRLMTCYLLALGPTRARGQAEFWSRAFGLNKTEPVPWLRVAALLASARFPGATDTAPAWLLRDDDPGVVAAALFAGAPVSDTLVQPFWRRDPPAHASLVWRGALLGALTKEPRTEAAAALVAQAQERLQFAGEQYATAREASALLLGRAGAVRLDARPHWRMLQLFAAESRSAAALHSWLSPSPQPLDDDPTRLAVEYVLSRSIDTVLADQKHWSTAESVRRHVATALAWRLCGESDPRTVEWSIAGLPEWFFVRWASGAAATVDGAIDDSVLDQAARLAAEGRLSKAAARRLLEEALWRWGSHPGLGLWVAQRQLVRDLLLAGSLPGNRYPVGLPDHLRYLPSGLGDENDFFVVAVELYEFLIRPVPPIPAECRLR